MNNKRKNFIMLESISFHFIWFVSVAFTIDCFIILFWNAEVQLYIIIVLFGGFKII